MQKLFNKILVPVDFSASSEQAIEKAVEIADAYRCSIILMHVVAVSPLTALSMADGHFAVPYTVIENYKELEFLLSKYKAKAIELSNHKITVSFMVEKGSWDETIIEYVNRHLVDLVVIGQSGSFFKKKKLLVNPDKIAEKTHAPVITIPSNKKITKLYSIVIPITDFLPVRKIMYGIYIASINNATLKLLCVENKSNKELSHHYLMKTYQLIRDNCGIKTELETIESENTAEAVNQYAMLNAADLVILNPGTQTKMPGFFSSLLGKRIHKYAAPPVLTVAPL